MVISALASGAATFRIAQFQFTLAPEQERPALEKTMGSLLAGLDADGKRPVALETSPDMRAAYDRFQAAWKNDQAQDRQVRQYMATACRCRRPNSSEATHARPSIGGQNRLKHLSGCAD